MSTSTAKSNVVVLAREQAGSRQDEGAGMRKSPRRRVLKLGLACFCNRHCTIPCTVRDISATGARLRAEGSVNIPDTFELVIELDGTEADCQVVWRKGQDIGVKFIGAPRKAQQRRQQVITPPANPYASSTIRTKPLAAEQPVQPQAGRAVRNAG